MDVAVPIIFVALGFYLGITNPLRMTYYCFFLYLIVLFSLPERVEESKLSPLFFLSDGCRIISICCRSLVPIIYVLLIYLLAVILASPVRCTFCWFCSIH